MVKFICDKYKKEFDIGGYYTVAFQYVSLVSVPANPYTSAIANIAWAETNPQICYECKKTIENFIKGELNEGIN